MTLPNFHAAASLVASRAFGVDEWHGECSVLLYLPLGVDAAGGRLRLSSLLRQQVGIPARTDRSLSMHCEPTACFLICFLNWCLTLNPANRLAFRCGRPTPNCRGCHGAPGRHLQPQGLSGGAGARVRCCCVLVCGHWSAAVCWFVAVDLLLCAGLWLMNCCCARPFVQPACV